MSDYDYNIVGSGPASFFLCLSILNRNPNAKIRIFEAGNKRNLVKSQNFSYEEGEQKFNLDPTTFIGFGGTSNLWHNVVAPLDEEDFQEREWINNSGWPIKKEELNFYYQEVANFLNFDFNLFNASSHDKFLKEETRKIVIDKDVFENKFFLQLKKPFRAVDEFIALKKKYSIDILLDHQVLKLKFNENLSEVKRIEAGVLGQKKEFEVKNLIICCGAIETTRLLLNSNIETISNDVLGHNFMDHPMGNAFQMKYQEKKLTKMYSDLNFSKQLKIKSAIKLHQKTQMKLRLPNHCFYLRPAFAEGIDNSTEKMKLKLLAIREKILKYKLPIAEGFELMTNINLARQILLYKTGLSAGHLLADYMFVTEQTPTRESNISLSEEKDIYGMPKAKINWEISESDLRSLDKYYDLCKNFLTKDNNANFTINKEDIAWKKRLASAAHHLGTARMGANQKNSVVDKNLRVHGSKNLYISDGSVFPTSGNANSTYTIMALSMRLGSYLEN